MNKEEIDRKYFCAKVDLAKSQGGGGWGTQPIFGYEWAAEGLKPWPCLRKKIPKIHTLFRKTSSILPVVLWKRSTRKWRPKHEAPKSRKWSTQNSKTKHPISKTKTPKSRIQSIQNSKTKTPKSQKRSTQKLETGLFFINTRPMLIQQESSTITNRILLFPTIEPGPRLLP